MPKRKLSVIILAHDGISSFYAGVGTAVNGYFASIDTIKRQLEDFDVKVWSITPKYADTNIGYNPQQLQKVTNICRSTGGDVKTCLNYSDGVNQYGQTYNWGVASASGAMIAYDIIKNDDPDVAIVVGVDTPFAHTHGILLHHYDLPARLIGIWMPHSTSLIHERGAFDVKRIEFELTAIAMGNDNPNLYTGYLNPYMKEHLEFDYGAQDQSLIPLLNGIVLNELKHYSQAEIEQAMANKGVPTDKPIVFSFGRGVPYKGFDLFMEAAKSLDDLPYHFVVQVAPYTMDDPIVEQLKALRHKNITLLIGLDFAFPRQLMQWDRTALVAVLSKFEPGAFIPAEIRVYGKPIALISDKDGLPCQVQNGIDGFITSLEPVAIASNMRAILQMPEEKRKEIAAAGKDLILDQYNIVKNFSSTIVALGTGTFDSARTKNED